MEKTSFTFTKEQMECALEANDWSRCWTAELWVHKETPNQDWGGLSLEEAFESLLKRKNLL